MRIILLLLWEEYEEFHDQQTRNGKLLDKSIERRAISSNVLNNNPMKVQSTTKLYGCENTCDWREPSSIKWIVTGFSGTNTIPKMKQLISTREIVFHFSELKFGPHSCIFISAEEVLFSLTQLYNSRSQKVAILQLFFTNMCYNGCFWNMF